MPDELWYMSHPEVNYRPEQMKKESKMTDRFHGLVITLENDIRADDAQPIIDAIYQIRGVQSVTPRVANIDTHLARERVRLELQAKLLDVLKEK